MKRRSFFGAAVAAVAGWLGVKPALGRGWMERPKARSMCYDYDAMRAWNDRFVIASHDFVESDFYEPCEHEIMLGPYKGQMVKIFTKPVGGEEQSYWCWVQGEYPDKAVCWKCRQHFDYKTGNPISEKPEENG